MDVLLGRLWQTLLWLHAALVVPLVVFWNQRVLVQGEEALRSTLHNAFAETSRFLSGLSTALIQLFADSKYRQSLRGAWAPAQASAEHGAADAASEEKPSTLNALLEALMPNREAEQEPKGKGGTR